MGRCGLSLMCLIQPQEQGTISSQIMMMSASLPCVAVQWAIVNNNNTKKERLVLVNLRFLGTELGKQL